MNIEKREERLMLYWQKDRPQYAAFNRDGIIDAGVWKQTDVHIVFVFKEMPGLNGDLRKILLKNQDRAYTKIRINMARWIYVMLYQEYRELLTEYEIETLLRKVAVVNLKKEPDSKKSERDEIWNYTQQDRRFIRKQIALYQPDFVVVCGFEWITELVHDVVMEERRQWKHNINKIHYFNKWAGDKKVTVISMPHPRNASRTWCLELQELMHNMIGGNQKAIV